MTFEQKFISQMAYRRYYRRYRPRFRRRRRMYRRSRFSRARRSFSRMFSRRRRAGPEMKMSIEHYGDTDNDAAGTGFDTTTWLKVFVPGSGISGGIGGGRSFDVNSTNAAINIYTSDTSAARIGNVISPVRIQFRIGISHPTDNPTVQLYHFYLLWIEDMPRTFASATLDDPNTLYANIFDRYETDTIPSGAPTQLAQSYRVLSREKFRDGAFKLMKHWRISTAATEAFSHAGTGTLTDGSGTIVGTEEASWSATGRNQTTKEYRLTFRPKRNIRYQDSAHVPDIDESLQNYFESCYALVFFPVITNGEDFDDCHIQIVSRMWYYDS